MQDFSHVPALTPRINRQSALQWEAAVAYATPAKS